MWMDQEFFRSKWAKTYLPPDFLGGDYIDLFVESELTKMNPSWFFIDGRESDLEF